MRRGALLFMALASAAVVPAALAQSSRSPFLPPSTSTSPEVTENAPLQFCGYMGAGEDARYCLFDPASRRSVWLPVGGESTGMRLESFDPEARTVQVVHGGRTLTLKLQTPTPAGGGGGGGPALTGPLPVAGQGQPNQNLVNTVVTNPTPADEAKRLEAVAAEVRRRRALRQAAAAQQQQQQQRPNGR